MQIRNAPHEAGLLQLDITKAKKELHWKPRWNSPQAIEKTILWYKGSLKKEFSKFELCNADIDDYAY
jgi:CDP-glucose 4,6-dehydratase